MKILLLEDEALDRKRVRRQLDKGAMSHSLTETTTLAEASEVLKQEHFDLLLIDHSLPDGTGFDLIRQVVGHVADGPAMVVISGNEDENLARDAILAGAHDFLLKEHISAGILQRVLLQAEARNRFYNKVQRTQDQLRHQAETDALTGLNNRRFFESALERTIARAKRQQHTFAVLLIDLDNFKQINDGQGHDAGDRLLTGVALLLRQSARQGDLVCRIGGDEFAMLAHDIEDQATVATVAERLGAIINSDELKDILSEAPEFGLSIGIALFPDDADSEDRLLKCADLALYRMKEEGKHGYRFYKEGFDPGESRRSRLEHDLAEAIPHEQMVLHWQPYWDARSGALVGAEALLRWQHPGLGLLTASDFLQIAENSRHMLDIARWTIANLVEQARTFQDQSPEHRLKISLSLNLSPRQLGTQALIQELLRMPMPDGFCTQQIMVEMTDMQWDLDQRVPARHLSELEQAGFGLVLDDFGRGGTVVDILQRRPLKAIKLDSSLIHSALQSDRSARYLRGLLAMARAMDLQIFVKRLETEAELHWCRDEAVDFLQGNLLATAVSVDTLAGMLETAASCPLLSQGGKNRSA